MIGVTPFSISLGFSDATSSVFASSPFEFVIDGNLLYIHAGLIALHSVPLSRMINGHMSEAQKGSAELQDVDKGTFVRFMRWAYNGTYSAADFRTDLTRHEHHAEQVLLKAEIEDTSFADMHVSNGWGSKTNQFFQREQYSQRTLRLAQGKQDMKESFIKRRYDVPEISRTTVPPRSNKGPFEDYSEVFLSHAQLYVFADKYDIEPLKKLVLHQLHQTLAIYTLYPGCCGDIIALIRYSYTNTADRTEEVDDLRALLTHYMGIELATLAQDQGFKTVLLEDGGAVLSDFLSMVTKRVD